MNRRISASREGTSGCKPSLSLYFTADPSNKGFCDSRNRHCYRNKSGYHKYWIVDPWLIIRARGIISETNGTKSAGPVVVYPPSNTDRNKEWNQNSEEDCHTRSTVLPTEEIFFSFARLRFRLIQLLASLAGT